eukprot:CAMPEP_0172379022 /NCGR_PEP_ID=MMETSP1060-20121228/69719_1 /TAXON_ID=37318 /ORGANISM="Pseudo-nitzschia pungens, Strain cf. cingulata" /LENGTH=461 /DNA_ID=CAMNT_0013106755 /DNA_START=129 /DNA_END=1514 /DNA_ORIENTATION=-
MFFQNRFMLLVASATLLASSASATTIRGVHPDRRELKKDKDKDNPQQVPVPAPRPPTNPPTPKGIDLWRSKCMNARFGDCIARRGVNSNACTLCLYGLSFVSSDGAEPGIINCGKGMCGGCVDEAEQFFECGDSGTVPDVAGSLPPIAPISTVPPVTLPPVPIAVPVTMPADPPLTSDYTYDDCPATTPKSGDQCVVPAPFKYQQCDYKVGSGSGLRCTCAYSYFMCNPAPIVPTPKPTPAPPPPTPELSADPGVCSATLPKSGDKCSTGGTTFIRCCYQLDEYKNRPTSPYFAFKCSCLQDEGLYSCTPSTVNECDVYIRPVTAEVLPEVPPPVLPGPEVMPEVAPEVMPEVAPEVMPEVAPEVMPEAAPEVMPEDPSGPSDNGAASCPPPESPPSTGDSCVGVLPESLSWAQCVYYSDFTAASGAFGSANICDCSRVNETWFCVDIESVNPSTGSHSAP